MVFYENESRGNKLTGKIFFCFLVEFWLIRRIFVNVGEFQRVFRELDKIHSLSGLMTKFENFNFFVKL